MTMNTQTSEVIKGRKNIAKFLGWSWHTIEKWKRQGLPLYKSAQCRQGSVFIYKNQSREWIENKLKAMG